MPFITVKKPFKFAHHGYQVEEFEPSTEPVETTDECAQLAVRERWAVLSRPGKASTAADPAAEQQQAGAEQAAVEQTGADAAAQ